MKLNKIIVLCLLLFIVSILIVYKSYSKKSLDPYYIGVLQSQTGPYGYKEKQRKNAVMFALDEINEQGGLLGREIRAKYTDAKSDKNVYVKETERLIYKEKVKVIIGAARTEARRIIKPIIEKNNILQFYTWHYEGLDSSKNIIYLGNTPNQQVLPAIWWSINNLGKKFFLVGTYSMYSPIVHEIMKDHIASLHGEVTGEALIPLKSNNIKEVVKQIKNSKTQVILHTILPFKTNIAFFKELADQNINSQNIPVMSFTITELDLQYLNPNYLQGNYATWSYLQSEDSATNTNENFVKKYKEKFGPSAVISDGMETAYIAVKLWAQAVKKANSFDIDKVKEAIKGQSIYAPEETVYVDEKNNHVWRSVNIGRIKTDGQFLQVWESSLPIEPVPFPLTRTKETWNKLLQKTIAMMDNNE